MDLLSAIRSVRLFPSKKKLMPLTTIWGEQLDATQVLQEYPRPQLKRDSYINLNGYWKYAISKSKTYPSKFDGNILVPFSPEASLSGVNRQLQPDEFLFCERTITINELPTDGKRLILHFGAVDQRAHVYINNKYVTTHIGGYLPFSADITDSITCGDNKLTVCIEDHSDTSYHSVGKQKLKRGGMFYTAQSGIWQTVWMEWVPKIYVKDLTITPSIDKETIHISLKLNAPLPCAMNEECVVCYVTDSDDAIVSKGIFTNHSHSLCEFSCYCDINNMKLWSPEQPYLYKLKLRAATDEIESYFAMREFSIEKDDSGNARFCLNHKPLFLKGVLDQGYWPDGLYTAPSDEALIYDIKQMKSLGFNMLRKHAKIEPARWYYHCDRLGMIVWQDAVNGGGYSAPLMTWLPTILPKIKTSFPDYIPSLLCRKNKIGQDEFIQECKDMIHYLKSFPCISTWVIFNEGWGQFHSKKLTKLFRDLDSQRLIDTASGWFDLGYGDFKSEHNYFSKQHVIPDKRAFVISECGGYVASVKGHVSTSSVYGYKICPDLSAYNEAYRSLMQDEIEPLIKDGLCGVVYTQLSDIEDEQNGFLTYDRKVCKMK